MDTAKVTLMEGMHFDTEIDGFHFSVDASADVGGVNAGPQPAKLLIAALAGCTAMDVISILRKKRQEVTHFEVVVNGARATEHPKIYTDIEIVYRVRGRDLDPAAVERAIQLSEEKYCPSMAMLRHAANIKNRYEIENEN